MDVSAISKACEVAVINRKRSTYEYAPAGRYDMQPGRWQHCGAADKPGSRGKQSLFRPTGRLCYPFWIVSPKFFTHTAD